MSILRLGLVCLLVSSCSESGGSSSDPKPAVLPEAELATLRARIIENLERAQALCKEHGIGAEQVSGAFHATDWSGSGEERFAKMPLPIRETMLTLYRDMKLHNQLVTRAHDEAEGLGPAEVSR